MRIGHHQMADHPCSFRPSVLCLVHAEQVDEPVEVGLQVGRVHAGEAPQVSLEPRAQVVDHLHGVEVGGVGGVGLVGLRAALPVGDHPVVGALLVVHDGAALREVAPQGGLDPLGRRLAVPAHHRDRVLRGVDGDRDANLLLGKPALAGLPVALREVGVVDVDLVDPDAAPEHDAVLVAAHRGEHAVAPLEGRLVGDAAQLGCCLDRHVPGHELQEQRPCRQVLLARLQNRPGQRVEAPPAAPASVPLQARARDAVPEGAPLAAARARRVRPERRGGLGVCAHADLLSAPPLRHGGAEQLEVVGRERGDAPREGVLSRHLVISRLCPSAHPTGLSPNKETDGHSGSFFVGREIVTANGRADYHPFAKPLDSLLLRND